METWILLLVSLGGALHCPRNAVAEVHTEFHITSDRDARGSEAAGTPMQETLKEITTFLMSSSKPARNLYVVTEDGVTCLVMKVSIAFRIQYETANGTKVAKINIPKHAGETASGRCGENSNKLTIPFFNNTWCLNVTIGTDTPRLTVPGEVRSTARHVKYSWKEIDLEYVEDRAHFPDAKAATGIPKYVHAAFKRRTFPVTSNGTSYKCDAQKNVELDASTVLEVSQLRYRAFGKTNNTDFPADGEVECAKDRAADNKKQVLTTAIIIVSVMAAACLVLIAIYIPLRVRESRQIHAVAQKRTSEFYETFEEPEREPEIM